jgi:hypothetical protein
MLAWVAIANAPLHNAMLLRSEVQYIPIHVYTKVGQSMTTETITLGVDTRTAQTFKTASDEDYRK